MQYYTSTRIKPAKVIMKLQIYDLFICSVTAFSFLLVPSCTERKGQNRRRYAQFHPPEFHIKPHYVHTAKQTVQKNMKGEKTLDNSEQKQSQVQRLEIFLRSLQAERKISASKWGQSEEGS